MKQDAEEQIPDYDDIFRWLSGITGHRPPATELWSLTTNLLSRDDDSDSEEEEDEHGEKRRRWGEVVIVYRLELYRSSWLIAILW